MQTSFWKISHRKHNCCYPLPSDLSHEMKSDILSEREKILSKVKEYIDKNLDQKNRNILNPTKDDFEKVPKISEILAELNVTDGVLQCLIHIK